MSNPAANPSHVVPASVVRKVSKSTPLLVNDGAVPPAQSTELGQLTVCEPPFVSTSVNDPALPDTGGFQNVKVFALVSTVAVITLPDSTSMSYVPPPVASITFTVSA